MPKFDRQVNSSSNSVYLRVVSFSASNVPLQPSTGLTRSSFTNTQGVYIQNRGTINSFALTTLAAITSPFTAGGFIEVHAASAPGLYRLDVPDAAFASGSPFVVVSLRPTTASINPIDMEIALTGWDNTDGVRGGLTALPNNTNLASLYTAFETGTAQAGAASAITLRSGASATNDIYKDEAIVIVSGTGVGQTNRITAYNGSTKVATVATAWVTQPNNTSVYVVLGRIG